METHRGKAQGFLPLLPPAGLLLASASGLWLSVAYAPVSIGYLAFAGVAALLFTVALRYLAGRNRPWVFISFLIVTLGQQITRDLFFTSEVHAPHWPWLLAQWLAVLSLVVSIEFLVRGILRAVRPLNPVGEPKR